MLITVKIVKFAEKKYYEKNTTFYYVPILSFWANSDR